MGFREHEWYRVLSLAGTAFLCGMLFWMLAGPIVAMFGYGFWYRRPPPEGLSILTFTLGMILGGPLNLVVAAFLPARIRDRVLKTQAYSVLAFFALGAVLAVGSLFGAR